MNIRPSVYARDASSDASEFAKKRCSPGLLSANLFYGVTGLAGDSVRCSRRPLQLDALKLVSWPTHCPTHNDSLFSNTAKVCSQHTSHVQTMQGEQLAIANLRRSVAAVS